MTTPVRSSKPTGAIVHGGRYPCGAEFGFELPIYEPEDEILEADVAERDTPGVAAVS